MANILSTGAFDGIAPSRHGSNGKGSGIDSAVRSDGIIGNDY